MSDQRRIITHHCICETPIPVWMVSTCLFCHGATTAKVVGAFRDGLLDQVRDAIKRRSEQLGETVGWSGDVDAELAEAAVEVFANLIDAIQYQEIPNEVHP